MIEREAKEFTAEIAEAAEGINTMLL